MFLNHNRYLIILRYFRYYILSQILRSGGYSELCDINHNRLAESVSSQSGLTFLVPSIEEVGRFFEQKITAPDYLDLTFFQDPTKQKTNKEAAANVKGLFTNNPASDANGAPEVLIYCNLLDHFFFKIFNNVFV